MNKEKSRKKRRGDITQRALDVLALALVDHKHKWTHQQRRLYEQATKTCTALLFLCAVWRLISGF